jgi:hypothetical protein
MDPRPWRNDVRGSARRAGSGSGRAAASHAMGHVGRSRSQSVFAHSSDGQTWNMPPRRGLVPPSPVRVRFPVGARDRSCLTTCLGAIRGSRTSSTGWRTKRRNWVVGVFVLVYWVAISVAVVAAFVSRGAHYCVALGDRPGRSGGDGDRGVQCWSDSLFIGSFHWCLMRDTSRIPAEERACGSSEHRRSADPVEPLRRRPARLSVSLCRRALGKIEGCFCLGHRVGAWGLSRTYPSTELHEDLRT